MREVDFQPTAFRQTQNGLQYAGTHVMIDMWDASSLNDETVIDAALRRACQDCGATLLDVFLHRFRPQGVTAVALLGESHMSIHTWPEVGYAASDVFTCGDCDPYDAVPALQEAFQPRHLQIAEQKRGITTGRRPLSCR